MAVVLGERRELGIRPPRTRLRCRPPKPARPAASGGRSPASAAAKQKAGRRERGGRGSCRSSSEAKSGRLYSRRAGASAAAAATKACATLESTVYVNRRFAVRANRRPQRPETSLAQKKNDSARAGRLPVTPARRRHARWLAARLRSDAASTRPPSRSPLGDKATDQDRRRDARAPSSTALQDVFYADRRFKLLVVPAGHRHQRQGRHDPRRVRPDERARRAHGRPGRRRPRTSARTTTSGASTSEVPAARRDRDLQPQPLRRRAGAGGRGLDHKDETRAALRPHQRLRAHAERDRHA